MKKINTQITTKISIVIALFFMAGIWQSCSNEDTPPPPKPLTAVKTEKVDNKTIKLVFNKEVEKVSAEKLENYTIMLGQKTVKPQKVTVAGQTVVLSFEKMFSSGDYTIKITNIKAEDGGVFEGDVKGFSHQTKWKKVENLAVKSGRYVELSAGEITDAVFTSFRFKDGEVKEFSAKDVFSETAALKNSDWDLVFSLDGIAMGIIANGTQSGGYPFAGKGFIFCVDEKVEEVKDAMKYQEYEKLFWGLGQQISADFGSAYGVNPFINYQDGGYNIWCIKDTEHAKDSPEFQQMVLGKESKTPFKILEKTIVFQTGDEKFYGKMIIDAIYKDNNAPAEVAKDYVYSLTFRYVIQEDGTNNLDIPIDVE